MFALAGADLDDPLPGNPDQECRCNIHLHSDRQVPGSPELVPIEPDHPSKQRRRERDFCPKEDVPTVAVVAKQAARNQTMYGVVVRAGGVGPPKKVVWLYSLS